MSFGTLHTKEIISLPEHDTYGINVGKHAWD